MSIAGKLLTTSFVQGLLGGFGPGDRAKSPIAQQNQAIAKYLPPAFAIDKGWHKDHPKPSIDRGFQILPNDLV